MSANRVPGFKTCPRRRWRRLSGPLVYSESNDTACVTASEGRDKYKKKYGVSRMMFADRRNSVFDL
jgi:hypothetical protein